MGSHETDAEARRSAPPTPQGDELAAILERVNGDVALDRLLPNLETMLARLRSGCCPSCGRPMQPPKPGQVREQRRASGGKRGADGRPRR